METISEAARLLGIPESTLHYYRRLNLITAHKSGHNYLVDLQKVGQELVEANYKQRTFSQKKGETNQ